jgi:hypothetical protein
LFILKKGLKNSGKNCIFVFGDDKGKGEFDEANLYNPFLKPGKSLATSHSWMRTDNGLQSHY